MTVDSLPSLPRLRDLIATVIQTWHDQEDRCTDWDTTDGLITGPATPEWERLAWRLQLINTFQWHEEDKSRAHGVGDETLGAVKRSIDASNRRRVQTIDELDVHLVTVATEAGVNPLDGALHSETPGSIIDRLTILALKRYHVAAALAECEAADQPAMQARLDTMEEQFEDLAGCLDRLLGEILAGRVRLKLYRQVKVYRDPETGKLRADVS